MTDPGSRLHEIKHRVPVIDVEPPARPAGLGMEVGHTPRTREINIFAHPRRAHCPYSLSRHGRGGVGGCIAPVAHSLQGAGPDLPEPPVLLDQGGRGHLVRQGGP